jgi:hypothetical protein
MRILDSQHDIGMRTSEYRTRYRYKDTGIRIRGKSTSLTVARMHKFVSVRVEP